MLESKYQHLQNILKEMASLLLAFSGGVDSTLLLKAAKDVLGDNLLAITALSEIMPHYEQEEAVQLAETFGVKHLVIKTHELDIPEFVKNPPDRCYICKKRRFALMTELAKEKGFAYVADGENADDEKDYRPGTLAARELGIRSPLREANLTKAEIRAYSKQLLLPTWDKPAYACLASRIPYHSRITAKKLRQIDEGEEFLRDLGFSPQLRVRHDGETARIELDIRDIPKMAENTLRTRVVTYFKTLGFKYVSLDLEGYRMGSLN